MTARANDVLVSAPLRRERMYFTISQPGALSSFQSVIAHTSPLRFRPSTHVTSTLLPRLTYSYAWSAARQARRQLRSESCSVSTRGQRR